MNFLQIETEATNETSASSIAQPSTEIPVFTPNQTQQVHAQNLGVFKYFLEAFVRVHDPLPVFFLQIGIHATNETPASPIAQPSTETLVFTPNQTQHVHAQNLGVFK